MFELHPQLAADCFDLGHMELCRVLLMNDARYPWCILVPQRADVRELHHLSRDDQCTLMAESSRLAVAMEALFQPDKLNVAALGNIVEQLHLHHVARRRDDAAWPGPVWGRGQAQPYQAVQAQARVDALRRALGDHLRSVGSGV